jgi:hypothetical protein
MQSPKNLFVVRRNLLNLKENDIQIFAKHRKGEAIFFCIILCSIVWLALSDFSVRAATIFNDSFQYGDFSGWEAVGGGTSVWSPGIGQGYDDSYCMESTYDGTTNSPRFCWAPIGSQPLVYINLFFKMSDLPDFNRGVVLAQLFSSSYGQDPIGEVGIASYWDGSNQEITSNYVYFFLIAGGDGTGVILTPSTGEWHGLQIMFDNTNNVQEVWLDGSEIMDSSVAVGYNVDWVKIGVPRVIDYCVSTVSVDQVIIANSYINPPAPTPTPTIPPWPTPSSTPSPYPTPIIVEPTNETNQFEHVTPNLWGYPANDSYSMCCHYDYIPQWGGEQSDDAWTATGVCAYYDNSQYLTNVGYWEAFWSNQAASMQNNQCGPSVCHLSLTSMYYDYQSSHTEWNITAPQYGVAPRSPSNLYSWFTQTDNTFIFNGSSHIYDMKRVDAYTFQNFYDLEDSNHIFFMESYTYPWGIINCFHENP